MSEKREKLGAMLERDRARYQREDEDIEAQMKAKGINVDVGVTSTSTSSAAADILKIAQKPGNTVEYKSKCCQVCISMHNQNTLNSFVCSASATCRSAVFSKKYLEPQSGLKELHAATLANVLMQSQILLHSYRNEQHIWTLKCFMNRRFESKGALIVSPQLYAHKHQLNFIDAQLFLQEHAWPFSKLE